MNNPVYTEGVHRENLTSNTDDININSSEMLTDIRRTINTYC